MDHLSDTLANIFEATSKLSENINDYFTYQDRSQAISAGQKAIEESKVVANEMTQQISKDTSAPGQRNESVEHPSEQKGKRIALFPGKFKPPHKGHYEFVNQVAKRPDVDKVMVLISPVDKTEVSAEESLEIWSKFLSSPDASPNISVDIADYRSPVTTVYEFLADPVKSGPKDTILLIKSSKDEGDTRFQNAKTYAERHNPEVSIEEIEEDPVTSSTGVVFSAEDLREFITANKKEEFLSYMPDSVDGEEIWRIFKPMDQIDSEIDNAIEEISSMAGGSVEGYSLPLGSTPLGSPGYAPASFPKKRRRKSTNAKVSRGKRQRRR